MCPWVPAFKIQIYNDWISSSIWYISTHKTETMPQKLEWQTFLTRKKICYEHSSKIIPILGVFIGCYAFLQEMEAIQTAHWRSPMLIEPSVQATEQCQLAIPIWFFDSVTHWGLVTPCGVKRSWLASVQLMALSVTAWCQVITQTHAALSVWYKTKFGSQHSATNFGVFLTNIRNVFKNMFNLCLMIIW